MHLEFKATVAAEKCAAVLAALGPAVPALINGHAANGRTPLMFAAAREHVAMVAALLKAGADPNATENEGSTALFDVAKAETVELLLHAKVWSCGVESALIHNSGGCECM